jgi:hypothetical protein
MLKIRRYFYQRHAKEYAKNRGANQWIAFPKKPRWDRNCKTKEYAGGKLYYFIHVSYLLISSSFIITS